MSHRTTTSFPTTEAVGARDSVVAHGRRRSGQREARLLQAVVVRVNLACEIAARIPCSAKSLIARLSRLRAHGAARVVDLWCPGVAGRPLHALTYVSLRTHDRRAMAGFEAHCRADADVTQAVLLAGRCDYALWSWHADVRAAGAWRWRLLEHPDVARADVRFVKVAFGHTLDGAPILTRVDPA